LSHHQTPFGSAVLSLCALDDEPTSFLAGTRGGIVSLFDSRTFWRGQRDGAYGSSGGGGNEAIRTASPVVGLKSVGAKSVVVAGMNGDVSCSAPACSDITAEPDLILHALLPPPLSSGYTTFGFSRLCRAANHRLLYRPRLLPPSPVITIPSLRNVRRHRVPRLSPYPPSLS
jgi:hypothetical protein